MTDVTLIGLGNMGSALGLTLLASGRSVTIWNRSPGRATGLLAAGAVEAGSLGQAVAASAVVLCCLKNHAATVEVLRPVAGQLAGRVVLDLSTGNAADAEALAALAGPAGAGWQIGMINGYPQDIGRPATALLCAGPKADWALVEGVVRTLGGGSSNVGTEPAAIPALFAAMFTARQAFMFGLAYGGAVCRRAGLPVETLVAQMEVTLGMARNYGALFARTVPGRQYDGSAAPVVVYVDALQDALATFAATGTPDALPRLMCDLAERAASEGLGDKELTVLVEMLAGQG